MYAVLKAILKELFVWNCHFWVSDPGGFFKLKDLKKQRKSLFRFFDQTQFLGKCFDKQTCEDCTMNFKEKIFIFY